jgi:hypothetical protein
VALELDPEDEDEEEALPPCFGRITVKYTAITTATTTRMTAAIIAMIRRFWRRLTGG